MAAFGGPYAASIMSAIRRLLASDNTWTGTNTFVVPPVGVGTVTSVSVVSANGLAGSVATATTTPAITLSTTVTGLLKGNGTAISAAVAGTDYQTPTGTPAGFIISGQTTGDILYASSSSAWSRLAGVAVGQVLISGGAGAAPSWSATAAFTGWTPSSGTATVTAATARFTGGTFTVGYGGAASNPILQVLGDGAGSAALNLKTGATDWGLYANFGTGFGIYDLATGQYGLRIANTTGALRIVTPPAFVAGDKYLVVDSNGNIHVSALGPAS